jgi:hypothetical protein
VNMTARSTLLRTLSAMAVCGLASFASHAQETKPAPPRPVASQPAKPAAKPPAAQQAKPASANTITTPQQRRRAAGVPEPTSAEQIAALPAADDDQKAAAELVHYGHYVCDDKFEVFVERNPVAHGYVDVRYKRDVWVMKPVASATGAIRLEDPRGRVLLVQIPFKSMLLNTQTGQRIVDSCQHDNQREAQKDAATAPSTDSPMLK